MPISHSEAGGGTRAAASGATRTHQEEIASSGVDPMDFGKDCEWEKADFVSFDVGQNVWHRTGAQVMLAPVVMHVGKKYGTVYIKRQIGTAKEPKEQHLLAKKPLPDVGTADLYDGVKRQQVCAFCSINFRKISVETLQPQFLVVSVAILRCRAQSPLVRVEQVVEGKVQKKRISLNINTSPSERADAHKLAAFQFYTFVQSKGKFVVVSLSKLGDDGDYWTEPVIHSTGKSLGDRTDEGDEGISKWMNEFSRVYSSMLQLSQEEIFTLEPKQFVRRLYLLGAFEVVRSPVVWKPSAEKSKDDEGLIVTSVQSPASSNWPQPESARMSLGVPRLYKDADAHVIVSGESSLVKMSSSGSISTRRGVRFSGQSSDVDG